MNALLQRFARPSNFVLPRLSSLVSSIRHDLGSSGDGRVVRRCWLNVLCRGVLLVSIMVGQGPTALAVGAGGCCLEIFSLFSPIISLFFLPLSGRWPDID